MSKKLNLKKKQSLSERERVFRELTCIQWTIYCVHIKMSVQNVTNGNRNTGNGKIANKMIAQNKFKVSWPHPFTYFICIYQNWK